MPAYINVEIVVKQNLEVEILVVLVLHLQGCFQTLLGQGDTVQKTELIRPSLPEFLTQHSMRQTKVELDRIITILLS
jgi:hypothetical protein